MAGASSAKRSKIKELITCAKCDERKAKRNYYMLAGDFKRFTNYGNVPICKDCQKSGFEELNKHEPDELRKYFIEMCQLMNKPFLHNVFDRVYDAWKQDEETDMYKDYFSAVSKGKYNTKGFINGDLRVDIDREFNDVERKMTPIIKKRWVNYRLKENDVIFLCEDMYQGIKEEYGITDTVENSSNLEKLVILKNREANTVTHGEAKDIANIQKAIKELEKPLGISKQRDKVGTGANTFGEFIRDIESSDPYMGDKLTYKDVDKLVKITEIVLISTGIAMGTGDKEAVRKTILKEWDVE